MVYNSSHYFNKFHFQICNQLGGGRHGPKELYDKNENDLSLRLISFHKKVYKIFPNENSLRILQTDRKQKKIIQQRVLQKYVASAPHKIY